MRLVRVKDGASTELFNATPFAFAQGDTVSYFDNIRISGHFDAPADFFASVTARADGDLTFDGVVEWADFRVWKNAFSGTASTAAPEPATALLFWLGATLTVLFTPRRRRWATLS